MEQAGSNKNIEHSPLNQTELTQNNIEDNPVYDEDFLLKLEKEVSELENKNSGIERRIKETNININCNQVKLKSKEIREAIEKKNCQNIRFAVDRQEANKQLLERENTYYEKELDIKVRHLKVLEDQKQQRKDELKRQQEMEVRMQEQFRMQAHLREQDQLSIQDRIRNVNRNIDERQNEIHATLANHLSGLDQSNDISQTSGENNETHRSNLDVMEVGTGLNFPLIDTNI